mgnify:CR=1 FL=1
MANHFNISGELTQELIAAGDNIGVSKISLTNVQKVSKCKVDLYIEKKLTGKFYLLKGVELPVGATLIYDDIKFRTIAGETFELTGEINATASTTIAGVSTLFLSEVSPGDEIVVSSETRTVSTVTSNTALTLTTATTDTSNDNSPDCNPTALVDVIIN